MVVWIVVIVFFGFVLDWLFWILVIVLVIGGFVLMIVFDYVCMYNFVYCFSIVIGVMNVGGFIVVLIVVFVIGFFFDV